jgi:hypothetical protein
VSPANHIVKKYVIMTYMKVFFGVIPGGHGSLSVSDVMARRRGKLKSASSDKGEKCLVS